MGSDFLIQQTGSSPSLPNVISHGARDFGSSFLGIWGIPQAPCASALDVGVPCSSNLHACVAAAWLGHPNQQTEV